MTFTNLLTNQIIISRLTALSADKFTYSTVTADIASIQRIADEKTLAMGEAPGKTYKMFCEEDTDIEVGDKIVDELGNEYKVRGVTIPANLGNFVHKYVILVKVK